MSNVIPKTELAPMRMKETATRAALMTRYGLTDVFRLLSQRYPHTGDERELAPSYSYMLLRLTKQNLTCKLSNCDYLKQKILTEIGLAGISRAVFNVTIL
jgi:hypothetical protein